MRKHIGNSGNHRIESKPPIAGEPIITASVTTIANTTPTIMKRLFISKILASQLKTDCLDIGDKYGRMF